jgi:hypothetical protein
MRGGEGLNQLGRRHCIRELVNQISPDLEDLLQLGEVFPIGCRLQLCRGLSESRHR